MYTIDETVKKLGISKPTLYKHMEKVNIPKGTKIKDEHITILQESIVSKSSSNSKVNVLTNKNNELTLELLNLKVLLKEKDEKLEKIAEEKFQYLTLINNKDIYIDNMQKQIIELNDKLKDTTMLLLEAPNKKAWWKR